MYNMFTIWDKALILIKEEIAEAAYNSFIVSLKPVSLDSESGRFILQTESEYNKERLGRYRSIIELCIVDVINRENLSGKFSSSINVEFVIDDNNDPKDVKKGISLGDNINPYYTFDTFVIGDDNKFAHACATVVAKNPGNDYNPLFIYGNSGLGKTHIVNAIANHILVNMPELDVLYVSSETFTNEMIESIKNKTNEEFRAKYRNIDVLIIDDIQFMANKTATQVEFFHTFETLYNNGNQIVITSDKPPKELMDFEERLKSRFGWSMVVDISPPDLETRNAILRKKVERENISPSQGLTEAIGYISEKIQYNVRDLEGALTKVIAYSKIEDTPITKELAKRVLKNVYVEKDNNITPDLIKAAVAKHFGIKVEDLESASRSRNFVYPRQIAIYLCRELTNLSLPKIGEYFGNRDHSTILHACGKIRTENKINVSLSEIIKDITEELKG